MKAPQKNRVYDKNSHRSKYLWCIVSYGILPAPLLEEKDNERDHESDKVALSEEGLPDAESLACFTFFIDGSLDLRHLIPDMR